MNDRRVKSMKSLLIVKRLISFFDINNYDLQTRVNLKIIAKTISNGRSGELCTTNPQ